jgi:hypothetical protein
MAIKKCPLCNQSVSEELYEKITGVWKAREEQEKELAKKKKEFLEKQKKQNSKFQAEKKKFIADQKSKVEARVKAKTEKYEKALKQFNVEKQRIQERADKNILLAVKSVEKREKEKYQSQLKANIKASVAVEVKKSTSKILAEKRKSDLSLDSARRQMSTLHIQSTKQQTKISDLERQLKNKTTPQLEGLLYEDKLTEALKKEFPADHLKNTGKGGDVLHDVVYEGEVRGIIVYECKKVKSWSGSHLEQTAKAKLSRKADFAILVTNANKKGTSGFFVEKDVIVVNPGGVIAIANILRKQLLEISHLKLTNSQRDEAIGNTVKYLQSSEYRNSLDVVIRKTVEMHEDLKKESQDHLKMWKKRHESLKTVYLSTAQVKEKTLSLLAGHEQNEGEIKPFPALPNLSESEVQQ